MSKYIKLEDAIEAVTSIFRVSALFGGINDDENIWREKAEKVLAKCNVVTGTAKQGIKYIEASDDCISRKALLEQIYADSEGREGGYGDEWEFIDTINNLPSIVPKPNKEYDYSKSVWENIKAGNGISREIPKEPSEDCISREWLVEEIARRDTTDGYVKTFGGREVNEIILNAPSVVPSRAEGKWIEHKHAEGYDGVMQSNFECSKCHDWLREQTNYCPSCGARMESDTE